MVVGICRIELHLPNGASLKGKRQILRSLKDRIKNRWNVSIAEVEAQDLWQRAVLGVACVGIEQAAVQDVIQQVIRLIRGNPTIEIIHYDMQMW